MDLGKKNIGLALVNSKNKKKSVIYHVGGFGRKKGVSKRGSEIYISTLSPSPYFFYLHVSKRKFFLPNFFLSEIKKKLS